MDITTMLYRIDCLVKAKGWTKEEFYAMVPISSSAVAQWKAKAVCLKMPISCVWPRFWRSTLIICSVKTSRKTKSPPIFRPTSFMPHL